MKKLTFFAQSCFWFFCVNATHAAQTLQISSIIDETSPAGELIFVVDDLDEGKKTPYNMMLKPGKNFQMFHIEGNHYQITQWTLSAPNLTFTACPPSQKINNNSLVMTINGKITDNGLHCSSRETAALIQLDLPTAVPASTQSAPTPKTKDSTSGYAEIANYLTSLSQQCKKGEFNAKFPAQEIDYTILGTTAGNCKVAIAVNKGKPLLCNFNNNDIALLASPAEIERYKMGNADSSPNSLNTRIMNARCKPM